MIEATRQALRSIFSDDLNPKLLPLNLSAGVLQGAIEVLIAASLASLIFSGSLEALFPIGITLALATGSIHLIGSAIFSSAGAIHSSMQDVPAVLVAVMLASVAASIGSELAAPTVLALLAVSTFVTGIALFALGSLQLGGLVRYVSYPVIGGFLAATGLLLVQGGFGAITGLPLAPGNIPMLLQRDLIVLWVPAVTVAIALSLIIRRADTPLAVPAVVGGALLTFYIGLLVSGTSIDEATQLGLLFEGGDSAEWSLLNFEIFRAADWGEIVGQIGNIAVLAGMTLIALLAAFHEMIARQLSEWVVQSDRGLRALRG